jgi:sporulation-control protein spo0M
MEIIDRLKGIVGVGQPTIEIQGVSGPARRGDVVRGTVVLKGGTHDTTVEDVHVRLDELRLVYTAPERPERQFWSRVSEQVIAMHDRVLKPGQTIELAFTVELPATLEPTSGTIAYVLVADTEVPGLNPRVEHDLTVVADAAAS